MARTTTVISVSLPPDLARVFERLAKSTRKGKSGLFREMVDVYQRSQWLTQYHRHQVYAVRRARDIGVVSEGDIEKLVLRDR